MRKACTAEALPEPTVLPFTLRVEAFPTMMSPLVETGPVRLHARGGPARIFMPPGRRTVVGRGRDEV